MKKSRLKNFDEKNLNDAIKQELYASLFYKNLANVMQSIGYFGCQKFFLEESSSELEHYQGLVDFVNDRGCLAKISALPEFNEKFDSLKSAFDKALEIEEELGDFYNTFYSETEDEYVKEFILKYIKIQRESVGEYLDLLSRLELCGEDKSALLLFDKEIA